MILTYKCTKLISLVNGTWLSSVGGKEVAITLELPFEHLATLEEIGRRAQLAIVIGGDGNMLGRARVLAKYDIPLIGINRGNLGFLTDIDPKNAYSQLEACLERGEFFVEERFYWKQKSNEQVKSYQPAMR